MGTIAACLEDRRWEALAEHLGFDKERHPIPPESLATWGIEAEHVDDLESLEVLGAGTGHRLLLARGDVDYRCLRRAMVSAHRHNSAECLIWWWVRRDTISVAVIDTRRNGRRFVRRMETSLERPDPVGLRQWRALDLDAMAGSDIPDPARRMHRHVVEVVRQESLTRDFFEGFRDALELLTDRMLAGPEGERDRHDIALSTLLRLVFVYFLQERGTLDRDPRFVLRHLRRARQADESIYRKVIRPLFFGALNRPVDERSREASALGALPFLNGGLFEPLPIEEEHPSIDWPNEVWTPVIEKLLERFHFTLDEGTEDDECRAVDPEMLGKVFEGVMYGETRRDSGSFYTPREVVRRLVIRTLGRYLTHETELSDDRARALLRGESIEMSASRRETVLEALRELRLLDPAVGTGAFLLEAMHSLDRCYRALGVEASRHSRDAYELRIDIVHRHLFGVDLQQTAVRICELRLWLALLASVPELPIEEMPTLPNLAHRIACGNSLLTPSDHAELRDSTEDSLESRVSLSRERRRAYRREMRELHRSFLRAHGSEKVDVRRRMEELERDIQHEILRKRREHLEASLEPLEAQAASDDLFGDSCELSETQREARASYREELEEIEEAIQGLERRRDARTGCHFGARFGPALTDEGFDVIVTNPPWIRAHRLEASRRSLLRARYEHVFEGLWPSASQLGIRAPFGTQIDVASVFVERSLELLRPGGQLGVLLPSKIFRSLHGAGVRRLIASHDLHHLEDYSEADRDWFDATVYPSMLHLARAPDPSDDRTGAESESPSRDHALYGGRRALRRRAPRSQSLDFSLWRHGEHATWSARTDRLGAVGEDVGEPWLLAPPDIQEAIRTMQSHARPLGTLESLQPHRGVMTGRNDVFIRDQESWRERFGDAAEHWTRPVLRGRDIRANTIELDDRIVWGYDGALEPCSELPDVLQRYFERHRDSLQARADHSPGDPLWQIFRLKEGVIQPKVVWRDLGPRLEASLAPAGVVPLNTVYFIPFECEREARLMAALLNSEPLRAVAYALGERARGGWRRHFAWVMRMLPIPTSIADWFEHGDSPRQPDFERAIGADISEALDRRIPSIDAEIASSLGLEAERLDRLERWRRHSVTRTCEEAA